ncbi:Chromosome partition protein MukB [Labilithrix luteola]|uniref:Chromosome partition protein MukB n=1 Tax=Labilithrix luteola TaxID=1391654 RepID=A0A0K1QDH4_9BACT|nr:chromosome partition protein MukB [Labilithrix luteola]AKV03768.1 Chromosome partition protein MukB [Labilithrix luteola]
MSRTCATALALVNWKGVFYERYLLDRHVTALEGANGAGKTTVMVAAYVVLLPDLARLRFTNLGETAATGGDRGLYGRLGVAGKPSYSAMELELADGSRLVAGVQLVRKSEPTLELTPFLVSGLDLQGSLKEILLVSGADHDAIPELDEIRSAVVARGGKMQVFGSAKEYFGALFDRGVNPLRLATDEERTKLHDMLRTSMTGGISRALTSELRSFLLKEESGLADTLVRMRANLDACRRTRTEVAEARLLEQEIMAIHAAGSAMFSACAAATEATARNARAKKDTADTRVREAEAQVAAFTRELETSEAERSRVSVRLSELRSAIDERTTRRTRTVAARAVAERLVVATAEWTAASETVERAAAERETATRLRDERITERDRAREAYARAASGLGDLQAGLDELHRRAHAQRTARTRLAEAQKLLGESSLAAEDIEAALTRVRASLADVDTRRARAERALALSTLQKSDYEAARAALATVRGSEVDAAEPHELARQELARLNALEHVASRRDALGKQRTNARAQAEAAKKVRARATALGVELDTDGLAAVERALANAQSEVRTSEDEARSAQARATEAARNAASARDEAAALESTLPRWDVLAPLASRLETWTFEEIARKRSALAEERERARAAVATAENQRATLASNADRLDQSGGFPNELLAVRDVLAADLLASRFETSGVDEAPILEAALGPLAHALVVVDPGAAADALSQSTTAPETVWLVAEEDVPRIVEAARKQIGSLETTDVVVKEALALRVTRRPSQPILGREARTKRATELRAEAERAERTTATALDDVRRLDGLVHEADRLLAETPLLAAGDPRPKAAAARQREQEARTEEADASSSARAAAERGAATSTKLSGLLELLAEAHRVISSDPDEALAEAERAWSEAEAAAAELERVGRARLTLTEKLDALRYGPTESSSGTEEERATLDVERDRLYSAERALVEVVANKEALAWDDVDAAMADRSVVRDSIQAQHDAARLAATASEEALRNAESAWERANVAWQAAAGDRSAREGTCTRLRAELAEAGGQETADASIEALDAELAQLGSERDQLASREGELSMAIAVTRERRARGESALTDERRRAAEVDTAHGPAQAEWRAFSELAEAAGVLRHRTTPSELSPTEHLAEARAQRALLTTRLQHARTGADGLAAVNAAFERSGDAPAAYLEGWIAARAWVMRRLPSQFADVSDPADALERLRADLTVLSDRVVRQETDLRGTSEDVARGIDVQLRKTANRVRRLNRDLVNVSFGSIGAIRVHIKRVERMELVLRALRGGEVQELLFQADLPFEDALAEVFRRYGGGGRAGAQRILDYREYLDLVVEVQRKAAASGEWEVASPTRLSTGEAIGVGAALMMVVLTEWERDANVLRSDRPTGTLRFLFLDEANRLSPDNLVVLFDLCRTLDLQLLVAAPEVARAFGNTTYRLVRHVDASGREEVLVSGRRAVAPPPEPQGDAPASEPTTEQAVPEALAEAPSPEPEPAVEATLPQGDAPLQAASLEPAPPIETQLEPEAHEASSPEPEPEPAVEDIATHEPPQLSDR